MTSDNVTQISLGKFKVGIAGLKQAIEEVRALGVRPEEEIVQALFVRLKPQNYIPPSAEDEYRQAFLREYRKALGETVPEEPRGLSIKILGPGCALCDQLEQTIITVLAELGLPAEVEHIRDVREIAVLGIMAPPAVLINGEVKAVGTAPTKAMLKKWLEAYTHQNNQNSINLVV